MNADVQLVVSADGSHTLTSNKFGVTYHSIHGSIDESIHVFLAGGLDYFKNKKKPIAIFEMGFGTGLNVWLSAIYAERNQLEINMESIECFPVNDQVISALNYTSELPCKPKEATYFKTIHQNPWGQPNEVNPFFSFRKHQANIMDHSFNRKYDIIFFDAFAPNTQPELWEKPLHKKLFDALNPGGILVTYCAKGIFKRVLKDIGYSLDKLRGPGKKHEMTRAIKSSIL